MDEHTIRQLTEYFESREDVLMAFLFGSQAIGRGIEESDVDVGVWLSDDLASSGSRDKVVREIWGDLERLLNGAVDLIVMNDATATIAWEAMRGLRLVVRDEDLFVDKVLELSREAEDLDEFVNDAWRWREHVRRTA